MHEYIERSWKMFGIYVNRVFGADMTAGHSTEILSYWQFRTADILSFEIRNKQAYLVAV